MAKPKRLPVFEPGHGFTKEERDAVSDNPEWTEEDFKNARPGREVFTPEFFAGLEEQRRSRGRPAAESPKKQVTLRIDADVVEKFREGGEGWQSRMNAALRKAVGL